MLEFIRAVLASWRRFQVVYAIVLITLAYGSTLGGRLAVFSGIGFIVGGVLYVIFGGLDSWLNGPEVG